MQKLEGVEETTNVFSALANPTRLKILSLVSSAGRPLHIKGVSRRLDMDYAAVYRHVQILESSGLLTIYDVGRSRVLSITDPEVLSGLIESARSVASSKHSP